jgi:hypothetical protein
MNGGWEHGYPGAEQDRWCVRRPYASETLCGRLVDALRNIGFFPRPELQPTDPRTQCRACAVKLAELAAGKAVCPVCAAEAPLVDGRVGPHGDCAGVNLKPRAAR